MPHCCIPAVMKFLPIFYWLSLVFARLAGTLHHSNSKVLVFWLGVGNRYVRYPLTHHCQNLQFQQGLTNDGNPQYKGVIVISESLFGDSLVIP